MAKFPRLSECLLSFFWMRCFKKRKGGITSAASRRRTPSRRHETHPPWAEIFSRSHPRRREHHAFRSRVSAAFGTAAAHLNPGGVLIASPYRYGETFEAPEIEKIVHSDCQSKLACLEFTYDPDPGDTAVETIMVFLIESQGRLNVGLDRHVTGLFPRTTWIRLMEDAGFRTEARSFALGEDKGPYDLLVGVLR